MLITIMIPTYNQENYILDAINSALSQTYENLEVVVCDDCSTDNTWEKVKSIKNKRLKIYRNDRNIGRVGNYRKLLYELSNGEFVINLDGDDYFTDYEYISKAVKMIQKYKLDLVFSNQKILYPNGKEKTTCMKLPSIIDGNWLFLNYGKNGIHIPHMTALYKRKKALELNFYSKDIISSDWESLLKFIINKQVGFITEASGVWRQLEGSESKSKDVSKYLINIEELLSIKEFAQQFFNENEMKEWEKRIIMNLLRDIPYYVIGCNIKEVLNFAYNNLSFINFIKFIFNYRVLGKFILGKFKCAE
jgi:glycosyltransferase involved in cell wall biosynthesis